MLGLGDERPEIVSRWLVAGECLEVLDRQAVSAPRDVEIGQVVVNDRGRLAASVTVATTNADSLNMAIMRPPSLIAAR